MNAKELNSFLANFGIHHGEEVIVSPGRYEKIIKATLAWYGTIASQMVADCFMPVGSNGEAIEPGYEDTIIGIEVWYSFEYPTLQEIEFISRSTHSFITEGDEQ